MTNTLHDKLRTKRADYDEECEWHRFLLDAYAGTGGFCGKVKAPRVGYLGAAATAYQGSTLYPRAVSPSHTETYLDRFPREDEPKFQRRIDVAHYDNYLGPTADLFLSYLNSGKNSCQGTSPALDEWRKDVTGTGVTWDALLDTVIRPRAVPLGWCPVLFDRDAVPDDVQVRSKADEQALGLNLRAVPLFPANVLDWEIDERNGQLLWVKLFTKHRKRTDPLGAADEYEEYRVFTRTTFSVYQVREVDGKPEARVVVENKLHGAQVVPLVIFRAKPTPDDAVRGISMVGEIASAQRRLFNLLSEQDEHIRANVFAILGIPVEDMTTDINAIASGTGSAIKVPMMANLPLHYVAPPESVATTLETRVGNVVREMHRMARAPFENDKGGAQAGTALAQKFDGTNRKISDASASLTNGEQEALRLVTSIVDPKADTSKLTVAPQREFRVDDIGTDIDNALKMLGMPGMPSTAKVVTIRRIISKTLHNLTPEESKLIDEQLDDYEEQAVESSQNVSTPPDPNAPKPPPGESTQPGDRGESVAPQDEAA